MPIKVLQSNDRVAEVQYICDRCGKLVRTSVITRAESETEKSKETICYQCKRPKKSKE